MILVENAFESFKILCVTLKKVLQSRICDSPRAPRPEGGHFFPRQDMNIKNDILSFLINYHNLNYKYLNKLNEN